jgi:hypothetical protein
MFSEKIHESSDDCAHRFFQREIIRVVREPLLHLQPSPMTIFRKIESRCASYTFVVIPLYQDLSSNV